MTWEKIDMCHFSLFYYANYYIESVKAEGSNTRPVAADKRLTEEPSGIFKKYIKLYAKEQGLSNLSGKD